MQQGCQVYVNQVLINLALIIQVHGVSKGYFCDVAIRIGIRDVAVTGNRSRCVPTTADIVSAGLNACKKTIHSNFDVLFADDGCGVAKFERCIFGKKGKKIFRVLGIYGSEEIFNCST